MDEKVKLMKIDFHERVSFIDEDFSKSQEKLENTIADMKKMMTDVL